MDIARALNDPLLADWLNPAYLRPAAVAKAQAAFRAAEPLQSIQLREFFQPRRAAALRACLEAQPVRRTLVPDRHSYREGTVPAELAEFLRAPAFASLLRFITGSAAPAGAPVLRSFGHRDYTLMHDKALERPGTDLVLHFGPPWNPAWGGSLFYFAGGEELLSIPPTGNSLSLVRRPRGVRTFVKYVNHHAGRSRFWQVQARR
jgi:hypothetical protein